jgi:hypothetical protein
MAVRAFAALGTNTCAAAIPRLRELAASDSDATVCARTALAEMNLYDADWKENFGAKVIQESPLNQTNR